MMEFAKSGYVLGWLVPTLVDYIREGNFIQGPGIYRIRQPGIFVIVDFEAGKVSMNIFVLVSSGGKMPKSSG